MQMLVFLIVILSFISGILLGKSAYDNTLNEYASFGTFIIAIILLVIAIAGISSI